VERTASGLELHLAVNADSIAPGETISISIWIYNPSASEVEVSSSAGWPLDGLGTGPCGAVNYPMGFLIMRGNLSLEGIGGGERLGLYLPGAYNCPAILSSVRSYVLAPSSSSAQVVGSCTPSVCYTLAMSANMSFSGEYTAAGYRDFVPGAYTVVGGDEWGGLTILHFMVR
jgi:hypothetical protein